jgi:high-affinity nickel permease
MIGIFSIIVLGFLLGMRHATDPDHVIAVSTIVSRRRSIKQAAMIGGVWGIGHTFTILLVGGGIILFGWVIPTRIGLSMEFSVGLMLILLGILNLTGTLGWISTAYSAAHQEGQPVALSSQPRGRFDFVHKLLHSPETHTHGPTQTPLSGLDRHFGRLGLYNALRPLVVGLIHGLAGSAAVALLVLTTIRDPKWAVAYLLLFGLGTIAGMMLITSAMGVPFAYAEKHLSQTSKALRIASGLISLGFGLFVVYQIGLVSGLFTNHPQWTPR